MLDLKHRNKMIGGLAVFAGAPKGMRPKYKPDAPKADAMADESPEEEASETTAEENDEGTQYASDALRAIEDKDPVAYREAIWGIMRKYKENA